MKQCKVCTTVKPKDCFYTGSLTCKECASRLYRQQWKERKSAAWSLRYSTLEGRAQTLLNNGRQRARQKQLAFDLDVAWVRERLQAGVCEVTKIPFDESTTTGSGSSRAFSPSLDRVIPELGYTKENTKVVCWVYNAAKGVNTHEDVMRMVEALSALK